MSEKILRKPDVLERVGIKNSTLYEWIKRGIFPRQRILGARAVGWYESEVTAWVEQRARAGQQGVER